MAEIKIRDISPSAVQKIDELASKKKQSRNTFLKNHLENLSVIKELQEQEERYTKLLNQVLEVLQQNTSAMEKMNQLILFLSSEDE